MDVKVAAPKGVEGSTFLSASLKRCPDTKTLSAWPLCDGMALAGKWEEAALVAK
jgi:hypothetical protein